MGMYFSLNSRTITRVLVRGWSSRDAWIAFFKCQIQAGWSVEPHERTSNFGLTFSTWERPQSERQQTSASSAGNVRYPMDAAPNRTEHKVPLAGDERKSRIGHMNLVRESLQSARKRPTPMSFPNSHQPSHPALPRHGPTAAVEKPT